MKKTFLAILGLCAILVAGSASAHWRHHHGYRHYNHYGVVVYHPYVHRVVYVRSYHRCFINRYGNRVCHYR